MTTCLAPKRLDLFLEQLLLDLEVDVVHLNRLVRFITVLVQVELTVACGGILVMQARASQFALLEDWDIPELAHTKRLGIKLRRKILSEYIHSHNAQEGLDAGHKRHLTGAVQRDFVGHS